jgi:hypothetical protein
MGPTLSIEALCRPTMSWSTLAGKEHAWINTCKVGLLGRVLNIPKMMTSPNRGKYLGRGQGRDPHLSEVPGSRKLEESRVIQSMDIEQWKCLDHSKMLKY